MTGRLLLADYKSLCLTIWRKYIVYDNIEVSQPNGSDWCVF